MKVGIYCRVSSESQRENSSLENQRILGEEFCRMNNYEFVVFKDVESGGKLNRKEFSRLIELCKKKDLDGLWVYDNDRLSRDYDVGGEIRKIIVKYKLKLFIGFSEVKLEEGKDRFEYNIRSVMSDYERERIVERFYYGKLRKWKEGKGLENVLFGYERNKDGFVVINNKESEVVKEVYKIYLRKDVKYFSEVENRIINKFGKVVNGKRLNSGLIGRIIGNRKYLGIDERYDKDGNKYEFNIGKIIEEDLITESERKLRLMKGFKKGNVKEDYLLKGYVKCGSCGSSMWVKRGGKVINGKIFSYYYCGNDYRRKRFEKKFDKDVIENNRFLKNKKVDLKEYERMNGEFYDCKGLKNNVINIKKLEKLVWESLFKMLKNSEGIRKEYEKRYLLNLGFKDRNSGKIKYYEKELDKFLDRKKLMYDKWLDGEIGDDDRKDWEIRNEKNIEEIKEKLNSLKKELKKFNNKIEDLDNYIDLLNKDLNKDYKIERFEDRRKIIEKYIKNIEVELKEDEEKYKFYKINVLLNLNDKINGFEVKSENLDDMIELLKNNNYKLEMVDAERKFEVDKNNIFVKLVFNLILFNIGRKKDRICSFNSYLVDY